MEISLRGAAALLMIAMPLALGAYLVRRFQTGWRLFLVGSVVFVLSQVLHIPFNTYLLGPLMAQLGVGISSGPGWALVGGAVLLGLSAGGFEEGARWLAYRYWIRRARSWPEGAVFGSGHGGAEAIITGLISLITLVQLTALRGQDLAAIVPAEQLAAAEARVEAYWAAPSWAFFLSVVERASALAVQITLAVIVLQAFVRPRGGLWLLAAIGWHALVDAVAVFAGVSSGVYGGSVGGAVLTEALIAGMAAVSLVVLFRLRPATAPAALEPPISPPHAGPVAASEPGREQVEASRYTQRSGR